MQTAPFDPDATLRALAVGQRVLGQRYTLVRVLGRGGMGVVWLAHDETLKHDVALKFLPDAVIHDAAAVHDLKQETQRSLKLTHPNIVRIHGFIEDGERAAISMEYVEGSTLSKRRLEQPGAVLAPHAALALIRQIVEALDYAHNRAKVVHRDIKPANLLFSTDGEVKIADFGISATLSDTATRISRRDSDSSGSPPYMSPQQMMGEKPSVADDIYALGATIYELLTSKPPFHTGNLVAQVQSKIPPTLQQRRAELLGPLADDLAPIPERWEKIIAACLAKDPADRPTSIALILRGLADPSLSADASSPCFDNKTGSRVDPQATPPPSRALAASAALQSTPLASPPPPVKRKAAWLVPVIVLLLVVALGAALWATGLVNNRLFSPAPTVKITARPASEVTAKGAESTTPVEIPLLPKPGTLDLTTAPSGATVTVKPLSAPAKANPAASLRPIITPASLSLPAGEYVVECVLAGYLPQEHRVQIAPNQALPLALTLEAQGGPSAGQTWTLPDLGLVLLAVEKGEFDQGPGPTEAGAEPTEGTATHALIPAPFWLGQNEITRNQWSLIMAGKTEIKDPHLPKTAVSYDDVLDFITRLNTREAAAKRLSKDQRYTLPTETQWEYACRAGTQTPFSSGDRLSPEQANFNSLYPYGGATPTRGTDAPLPVGTFPANPWGFRDMHGNVWEWCLDTANATLSTGEASAAQPATTEHIARGGAWCSPAHRCRSSARLALADATHSAQLGFRLALVPGVTADSRPADATLSTLTQPSAQ